MLQKNPYEQSEGGFQNIQSQIGLEYRIFKNATNYRNHPSVNPQLSELIYCDNFCP